MGLSVLQGITVTAKAVHRMSAFSRITSKILGAASLAGKAGSMASLAVHGAQIAGSVINGLEVTRAVGGWAAESTFKPFDDFRLNKDGSVSLIRRTNDKSHSFFNDKGEFLFKIGEKLGVRKDWNTLSGDLQKEVAWATTKVGLQVYSNANLRAYIQLRADEVGWDATAGVKMLTDLGKRNEQMLGVDVVSSFTPLPISQNYREGKPAPLTSIFPGIKEVDRFYPVLTNGRDLQYDLTHPNHVIDATKNIQGVSFLGTN